MRIGNIFAVTLIACALAACQTYPTSEEDLETLRSTSIVIAPVSYTADGSMMIDVGLNGYGPYSFLIDTGSTTTAIFDDTRRALGLPMINGKMVEVRGIVETDMRPVASISSLTVGSIERRHKETVILSERRNSANDVAYGLLGLDMLGSHVIAYDHELAELYFLEPGSLASFDLRDWVEIPLYRDPYETGLELLYFSEVDADGRMIPALIDLGSVISMLNWADVENFWLRNMRSRLEREWRIEGAVGEFRPRIRGEFELVVMGEYPFRNVQVLIYDFNSVNVTGSADQALFIAGVDMFREEDFVIDFPAGKLYLPQPSLSNRLAPTGTRIIGGGIGSAPVVSFGTDR